MLRRLLERTSRSRSIRRRLPREYGSRPLYLSPDAALSYLRLNWAAASGDLLSAVNKYVEKGDNVWDIGANVGVFAFAAAHVAGKGSQVLAIEADPFLASLVQRSALESANQDLQVEVLCAAVSDETTIARLLIAQRGRASNALERSGHRSQAGGTRYTQNVATVTLDGLLEHFSAPGVIKIDVEGAETYVLEGASDLLTRCRPRIYVEVGKEQNDAVTGILLKHKYRLYDGDSDDGVELPSCVFNTLAVPDESSFTNAGAGQAGSRKITP